MERGQAAALHPWGGRQRLSTHGGAGSGSPPMSMSMRFAGVSWASGGARLEMKPVRLQLILIGKISADAAGRGADTVHERGLFCAQAGLCPA